jgi:serine/threonine protein kinase
MARAGPGKGCSAGAVGAGANTSSSGIHPVVVSSTRRGTEAGFSVTLRYAARRMHAPPQNQSPPFHPHVFGKFYLLQKVATGGMAEIFRAKASGAGGFEKELAVKRILPSLSRDQNFVRMLVNEAKLTVSLTHPTIAQVYELGEIGGVYFISMEYVEGATLHDLLHTSRTAGRPLTIEQCIYLCLEILRGLDFAHRRTDNTGRPLGVIHCDVSPDNAMVTWDGGVKLLDFGIARAAQTALSNYREGTLMGKLNYLAPEQAEGAHFDHRVDIFAVGVMLYELLVGVHPFGRVKTVEELRASRRKEPLPPSRVKPELPRVLDSLLLKALALRPDDRFPNAKEMADALVDLLFPTPTLAIAEHLSATMRELYRERIERQRRIRASDPLTIKVLVNARQQAAVETTRPAAELPAPPPVAPPRREDEGTHIYVSAFDLGVGGPPEPPAAPPPLPSPSPAPATGTPRRPATSSGLYTTSALQLRRRARRALVLGAVGGLALGIAGAVGFRYLRGPAVVVLSEPAGAAVFAGDEKLGVTPLVLGRLWIPPGGRSLRLTLDDHRDRTLPLEPTLSSLLRLEAVLPTALGTVRVESDPPGAKVTLDGEEVGQTPLEVPGVRLDRLHRFDLVLRGHELDSFIVRPDDDGTSFTRKLRRE